uniref:Peptidase S1 domain-containing protein n=1 Tax=Anopheles maculatus TaxID=74869 RepID=A0A182SA45_9DIPT
MAGSSSWDQFGFVLAAAVLCCCLITPTSGNPLLDVPDRRINNGVEAGPTDIPFAAGVLVTRPSQTYFCGGTLISLRHILTSANCVDGYRTITVMLGAYDMTMVQDFITVSSVLVHPNFSSFFYTNDLAILTLSRPAQLSERVQIVQLPSRLYIGHSFNNYETTIAGWGQTGSNTGEVIPVRRLLYFRARVITNTSCLISFPLYLSSTNICTSTGEGAACVGDEGGPVTVTENGQTILIGVHSYGFSMGCERSWPSVHTRITEYLTWIENNSDAPNTELNENTPTCVVIPSASMIVSGAPLSPAQGDVSAPSVHMCASTIVFVGRLIRQARLLMISARPKRSSAELLMPEPNRPHPNTVPCCPTNVACT